MAAETGAGDIPRARRRSAAVAAFTLAQALGAVFFISDAVSDIMAEGSHPHLLFELVVAVALVLGVAFGFQELRRTLSVMRAQERALDVAAGALAEVIGRQFGRWGLTPAEREIGLLALKGFDVAEIAELRGAAQGTVRAQMASIYAKSGLSGRAQFAAHFVEDLLVHGVDVPAAPAPDEAAHRRAGGQR